MQIELNKTFLIEDWIILSLILGFFLIGLLKKINSTRFLNFLTRLNQEELASRRELEQQVLFDRLELFNVFIADALRINNTNDQKNRDFASCVGSPDSRTPSVSPSRA